MSKKVIGDFDDNLTMNISNNDKNLDGHDDDDDDDSDDDHEHDMVMPGFRFHPTEEELIDFYLRRKVEGKRFNVELITFLDLYRHDPWELPALAAIGEKEWYFYVPRDRKYRNGDRPNRVTTSGYWKATGADRVIRGENSRAIGLKKTLVFYSGKAPKGIRTSWIMNEYRLPHQETEKYQKAEISLCRVYKRPGVEDHPSLPRSLPTRANSSFSKGALTQSSSSSSSKNPPINHPSIDEKMNSESGDGSTTTTRSTNIIINNNNNNNSGMSMALALSKQQTLQSIYFPMASAVNNSEGGILVNNSVDELQRLMSYQSHQYSGHSNINQQYYHIAHQLHQQQPEQQDALQLINSTSMPQSQSALATNVLPVSLPNGFSDRLWEMWNPAMEGNREYSNQFK